MIQNPWKGLAPYREPKDTDESSYLFCGRDKAARELTSLIKSSLFVTLYGRTGVGKTSLLEAGVFPMLRPAGYIPVPVRLSMDGADGRMMSFAGCITDAVERTVNDIRLTAAPVHTDTSDKDYLWEYFATRHFYEGDREVFPVIVIDQFEENFSVDKEGTWRLMEQLHSLMDDNKIYPDNYHNETIFRIVLSIREDDLYRLEDCIDQLNLNDFKFNRYRLTQLSDDEAREIIVIPGAGILPVNENDRDTVVRAIIKVVKDGNDGNINTLILSLVCSVLYDRIKEKDSDIITLDDVHNLGTNPLKDFYLSIAAGFHKYRSYIEDRLVDADGRRNSVHREEMSRNFPYWESLLTGSKRILQCSNDKVELIHDMLARAIYDVRLQRDNKRKSRIARISILMFLAAAFIFAVFSTVYDISGKDHTRLQAFPREGIVTDSGFFSDNRTEKLVWEGTGALEVSHCPSLRHIVITNPATSIHINDCPNLTTIEFPCESVSSLNISNCPNIRNLNIPEQISSINTYGTTRINSIIPPDCHRYEWLDGILWDIQRKKVVFISDDRNISNGICFPYEMRDRPYYIYSASDTLRNIGIWIDNLLFTRDSSRIISSINPLDPVLDLNKYPGLTYIESNAFHKGNGIRKLILKKGLSLFSSRSFDNLSELDTIEAPENTALFDIVSKRKITYVTDGNDTYNNTCGIIRRNGEPIWISSEYPDDVYTEGSLQDLHGLTILSTGFYCRAVNFNGNITVTLNGGITDPEIAGKISALASVFDIINYRGNSFFKTTQGSSYASVLSPSSRTLHIPPDIHILDCSGLSPQTNDIIIESTEFDKFLNLPDSLRRRISIYVPFGHQNSFLNREEFKQFRSINKTDLCSTLYYNVTYLVYRAYHTLYERPGLTVMLTAGLLIICILFYILNTTRYIRRFQDRKVLIIRSCVSSLIMTLITLFSWIVAFWLIRYTFNTETYWVCVTGASIFAISVLFSLYYSTLMEFKKLKAGSIMLSCLKNIRHATAGIIIRMLSAVKDFCRVHKSLLRIFSAVLVAVTAIICIYLISYSRSERRLLAEIQALASSRNTSGKEKALAMLTEYLDKDSSIIKTSSSKAFDILLDLARELQYDYITGIPAAECKDDHIVYSRDSSIYAEISENGVITLWGAESEQFGQKIEFHKTATDIDISQDGTMITAACGDILTDYDIAVYNIRSKMSYSIYCGFPIEDICFSPDNRYIATGCSDRYVRIWDLSLSPVECTRKLKTDNYNDIRRIYFSDNGKLLYVCLNNGTMDIWSLDDRPDSQFILEACRSHLDRRNR